MRNTQNTKSWRYFVVMRDFGNLGREAIVDPQHTASNIVDLIATKEWPAESIIFIHVIQDGICADVTEDFLGWAETAAEGANPIIQIGDHAPEKLELA